MPVFVEENGSYLEVTKIILEMLCSFSPELRPSSHHILGDTQITQASIVVEANKDEFVITTVQEISKPNQVNVNVQKIPK